MATQPPFLGRGWSFPPAFTARGADVVMVSGAEDIRQSIEILLATHSAERLLSAEYGCDLSQFLYEEVDRGLINGLTSMISDAILLHEPRILLNGVEISDDEAEAGRLIIRIDYTIRATNTRHNLVYPFYLLEATSVT